jgi:hypothetical protein
VNNWRKWLNGLIGAAIGSGASAIANMVVDPTDFNLHSGLAKLGQVCLVSGLIGAALYLKQHPTPEAIEPPK